MDRIPTDDEIRAWMRRCANSSRDTADELAQAFGGCDDPMHPFMPTGDPQEFRDWVDFTERVARPITESDNDAEVQEAMRLYRKAPPHFIAVCLVMALNRVGAIDRVKALHQRDNIGYLCDHCNRSWPCPTIRAIDPPTDPLIRVLDAAIAPTDLHVEPHHDPMDGAPP